MSVKTSGKRAAGKTDWARLRAMSDEEIERNARMDPDNPPAPAGWLDAGTLRRAPNKVPISMRVDADILEYFRKQGEGYQSRMNAVLRRFMEHALAAKPVPKVPARKK